MHEKCRSLSIAAGTVTVSSLIWLFGAAISLIGGVSMYVSIHTHIHMRVYVFMCQVRCRNPAGYSAALFEKLLRSALQAEPPVQKEAQRSSLSATPILTLRKQEGALGKLGEQCTRWVQKPRGTAPVTPLKKLMFLSPYAVCQLTSPQTINPPSTPQRVNVLQYEVLGFQNLFLILFKPNSPVV